MGRYFAMHGSKLGSTILNSLAALTLALSVPLASDAAAQSAPRDAAAAYAYLATVPAAERLAVLKREAAREGELVIYSAIGLDRSSNWLDPFKKENPGIKVEYLRMTTNETAQKVVTEFRAGRTNMDL